MKKVVKFQGALLPMLGVDSKGMAARSNALFRCSCIRLLQIQLNYLKSTTYNWFKNNYLSNYTFWRNRKCCFLATPPVGLAAASPQVAAAQAQKRFFNQMVSKSSHQHHQGQHAYNAGQDGVQPLQAREGIRPNKPSRLKSPHGEI